MIKPSDFEKTGKGIYASENTRRIIITEWGKSLRGVITYHSDDRKMGWWRSIRTEAINVQKYEIYYDELPYEPFIYMW